VTPRFPDAARLAGRSLLRWQTDERLAGLAGSGNERAFEAIVERYRAPLLRYCQRLLPSSRAEDALQQAFMNAFRALGRGDRPRDLRPWLYRIAHNSALNALREGDWDHAALEHNREAAELVEDAVERREQLDAVLTAIDALPARQRDAVLLHVLEGRSYEDVAETLGVSQGAVRQLLHRSRATLRTAATAVTPIWLLDRAAAGGGPSENTARIAELVAGGATAAGTGSLAKVGAAVLATGAIAGTAIELENGRGDRSAGRESAAGPELEAPSEDRPEATLLGAARRGGEQTTSGGDSGHDGSSGHGGSSGPSSSSGSGSSGEGSGGDGGSSGDDGSGGDSSGSGSGDGSGSSGSGSGGDGDSSGPGGGGSSGGGDSSGSGGSGSGGSGSSGSGGSGSSGSGSSGSGGDSDSSGSESSGSGSGSSGSGSSGSSGDLDSSGSGSSGSG
jgi:RNA polymerase sigma factor (sigma-70 family)